ncbi:MAG TPA: neutral zinc metallopeptidase [Solirubrobacteraceae bacterium]|nr:neutral zinc metallopeptidase [Solirubrobacteraceae bacterium]
MSLGDPRCCGWRPLLLGLVLLTAGCGSSSRSSATSSSTTTKSSGAASFSAAIAGHDLDRLRQQLPHATAKLPSPSSAAVERDYLTAVADDAQRVWRREFKASHLTYRAARVVLFSGKVKSDCGEHEDSGPFYCPADRTVYLDVLFFTALLNSAGVGSAAQAYIVGHEFGHHVQQLLGIAGAVADANEADPGGKNARQVKVELQADCLAGVWGRSAYPRSELTIADLNQALKAAEVIGDDYLQRAAGNVVDSALWTHGSSQQRQHWVRTGYESGRPNSCDTFAGG